MSAAAAQFTAGLIIAFNKICQLSLVLLAGIPVIGGATSMVTKVLQIYLETYSKYIQTYQTY
jgi:hypothetical protein